MCLPPTFAPGLTNVGQELIAVGWGMTENGRLSDRLQQVKLPVVDPERCKETYGAAFGDNQVEAIEKSSNIYFIIKINRIYLTL